MKERIQYHENGIAASGKIAGKLWFGLFLILLFVAAGVLILLRSSSPYLGALFIAGSLFFTAIVLLEINGRRWSVVIRGNCAILKGGRTKTIFLDREFSCHPSAVGDGDAALWIEQEDKRLEPCIFDRKEVIVEVIHFLNSKRTSSEGGGAGSAEEEKEHRH
jgi:hypothetical protein